MCILISASRSTVLKQFQLKKNNTWEYRGKFIDLIYILKNFYCILPQLRYTKMANK